MIFWRILFLIGIASWIFATLILMICRFRKSNILVPKKIDNLFKEEKTSVAKNYMYATSGETHKYIPRYILRKGGDKAVICNFKESFALISYYIVCYRKHSKKPIDVIEINEYNTSNTSRVIAVNKHTKVVNIILHKVNDVEINSRVVKPLNKAKINLYCIFSSMQLFNFLFVLRHIIIELVCGGKAKFYFDSMLNLFFIIAIFVIAVIYALLMHHKLRKRNKTLRRNGGALEYEFI